MALDDIPTTGDLMASASGLPSPDQPALITPIMVGPGEAQIELSMTAPAGVSPAEAMGTEAVPIPMESVTVSAPSYPRLGIALLALVLLMALRGR